jgi:4-hydroxy-tetrahydrodipicolinate reductase
MMRIAIIGYGRMGRLIHEVCRREGIEVASIIDPGAPGATHPAIDDESMQDIDVCIDFSSPDQALGNLEKIARFRKNVVMGTTGWYDRMEQAKEIAQKAGIGVIWSGNFSLGMNIYFRMLRAAARLFNRFSDYDIYGHEAHHKMKADAPSGTATMITRILTEEIDRKSIAVFDRPTGKIAPDELHFASIRGGSVPGTHSVSFDSAFDTIELRHVARSREGFAVGAVQAARWIDGKSGFFGIEDMMDSLIR